MADVATTEENTGTRQAILDAAARCVRRYGLRRTTMEEVARLAGVSRGTVHRYFRDKDTLVREVLSHADSQMVREITAAMDPQPTLLEQIVALALHIRAYEEEALLELRDTEPEVVALMLTSGAGPMLGRWVDVLSPYVEAAVGRGEVRADLDVRRASEWIMRMILSLVTTPSVTFDRTDPADLRAFLADHLIAGLGPSRSRSPRSK
ncbi:MAG: TetR/AcrR family transcriptional regulator [Acidimicrobiia bacterium]